MANSMDSLTMQNVLKPLSLSFYTVAKSYEECFWGALLLSQNLR